MKKNEYNISNLEMEDFIKKYTKDTKTRGILKDKIIKGFTNEDISIKYNIFSIKYSSIIGKILSDFKTWLKGEIKNES